MPKDIQITEAEIFPSETHSISSFSEIIEPNFVYRLFL